MRPWGVTPVASTTNIEAPEIASVPRCIRCQSVIFPLTALYWHIGAIVTLLASAMLPIDKGVNSLLPISALQENSLRLRTPWSQHLRGLTSLASRSFTAQHTL